MTTQKPTPLALLDEIVALETQVWQALLLGDSEADSKMLTDDFLGVYPSGFSNKAEHCGQLENGPVMTSFSLTQSQLRVISTDAVLLSYRASYLRVDGTNQEEMYISSLWQRSGNGWMNSFSQDTPAD
ncbi:DUF4440 domain-containing protein [Parasedimentitalea maritima]|uniref:DUF4440 domain-containing protein n=1 Tax=Parasedimentitalea maritima TaxID=2578117 RepID=A0A6A4R9E4_9RHOB|nr:nuclear transport factor 2 family protein [Zongyanglinia marina]KAE9625469.1 DUF4440 domain-containing protein [Zongyanglinia marina]